MASSSVKRKYYVVWEGRATGVFDSWEECKEYVDGYQGRGSSRFPPARPPLRHSGAIRLTI